MKVINFDKIKENKGKLLAYKVKEYKDYLSLLDFYCEFNKHIANYEELRQESTFNKYAELGNVVVRFEFIDIQYKHHNFWHFTVSTQKHYQLKDFVVIDLPYKNLYNLHGYSDLKDYIVTENDTIDLDKPYTIVLGERGIGKSVYIEQMKKYNTDMQYLEAQAISWIKTDVVNNANDIIVIHRWNPKE